MDLVPHMRYWSDIFACAQVVLECRNDIMETLSTSFDFISSKTIITLEVYYVNIKTYVLVILLEDDWLANSIFIIPLIRILIYNIIHELYVIYFKYVR